MEDKKLIVIDCDGVLYPKEKLPTKEIVCAVRKAFEKKGISKGKTVKNLFFSIDKLITSNCLGFKTSLAEQIFHYCISPR